MNVTILGCGAYGTALAVMFKENNCNIKMWNKFDNNFDMLRIELSDVIFTTSMEDSVNNTDLIVIAIPLAYLEDTVKELSGFYDNQDILIASKGIDTENGLFASEILKKYINCKNIGAISGGTFAIDMKDKKVMGITLGSKSDIIKNKVKNMLENKYLKVQYCNDILGVQICGSVKNIMAIGFGILDGANYPESSRFLFLTEAIYEINYLIKSLGGDNDTILSYAGIDDIAMTCTSSKSRNYTMGKLIGSGESIDNINKYKEETTVEGVGSALGINTLCSNRNINLNMCKIIYDILYNNTDYKKLIDYLINKRN